jgi:putative hydrolase of the HAD superfamily
VTTVIGFEVVGTVCRRTDDRRDTWAATFEAVVGDAEDAWVDHAVERVEYHRGAPRDRPRERAAADVCERFDRSADPAALSDDLRDRALEATTVSDEARRSLTRLAETNHLAVLTDAAPGWTDAVLDRQDIADHFDAVVTASEAGASKPDSEPFDLLRERLGADEYVHVGPDYERDVEGARAAGFVPIHFEDEGPDLWQTLDALL